MSDGVMASEYMVLRDCDCTKDTPIRFGGVNEKIYGKGIRIKPFLDGRLDTVHMASVYLKELLPLEEYDKIIVLLSGGKDSVACLLKLLELGVPREKIELWHHDIDGGHPTRKMDWSCTKAYCEALAKAFEIPLRISYREGGFFSELYRIGASNPVAYVDPYTGEHRRCELTRNYLKCKELVDELTSSYDVLDDEEKAELMSAIKSYGFRRKFPAKLADLKVRWCSSALKVDVAASVIANLDRLSELGGSRLKFPAKSSPQNGRWCSSALKASVADSVTANLEETKRDKKILIVSGERRGESSSRAKLNEMELHRTNAPTLSKRIVHSWKAVIDWTEKDVWEILKRHCVIPHPCYRLGWNRCSCAFCIFSTPKLFAGIRELFPEEYELLKKDEQILGFTIDNKKSLDEFVGDAKPCIYYGDTAALKSVLTGTFDEPIFVEDWQYPAGAFHGAEGGPC